MARHDGSPVVADVRETIHEAGTGRHVFLGARPPLSRAVIVNEHAGAVVAQVTVPAVQEHVRGEQDGVPVGMDGGHVVADTDRYARPVGAIPLP